MPQTVPAASCQAYRVILPHSLVSPLARHSIDRQVHVMAIPATDMDHASLIAPPSHQRAEAPSPCSFQERVRSRYHAFWYHLGERVAWSRGIYRERPAQELDQGWSALRLSRLAGGTVQDIESSNFWYAPVLHTFFRPTALIGVEVEGHRMYINGYSRHDYAKGYIQDLPNTEFHIQDYRRYSSPASIITAWYPFVTPAPVLAWRLPLSLLAPHDLFSQVMRNLQPHGLFLMINHGRDEASIATSWCRKVGLAHYGSCELRSNVRPRLPPPVLSCWMRAPV